MKILNSLILAFSTLSLITFGQNGIYLNASAILKDSLIPDYVLLTFQKKGDLNFTHQGQTTTFKQSNLFGYSDKNGELVRIHPEEGPLKIFIEGAMCLFAHPFNKMDPAGNYPRMSATVPNTQLYFSLGKAAELIEATGKNLKKAFKGDPEIFEIYSKNKDLIECICEYNKKHPTANDKFYYRKK